MCKEHCHESSRRVLIVTSAMLVIGLLADAAGFDNGDCGWLRPVWYALAFLLVGNSVLTKATMKQMEGDVFNELTLMEVAAFGAFIIGEYPEAVAVMLLFQTGESLQHHAVSRARGSISSMMRFRPDRARVVEGTVCRDENPSMVAVGDIIEVRPGERVPLDGELLSGDADFDTVALTGESLPRTFTVGDEVSAGMVASSHVVRLKVLRPAADSAIERIRHIVEEASSHKAPTELFIRRFARIYTPVVFVLAVLLVVVPWVCSILEFSVDYDFRLWFYRALIFLVISCPCALVISVPLAYFAGIGAASRRGILFKGGGVVDAIADIDTVAFDKTGTLTTGRFVVSKVVGLSRADLSVVAAMERTASHPLAQAVAGYASGRVDQVQVHAVKTLAGYGLEWGGWLAGSCRLLESRGIVVPESLHSESGTVVAVAFDGAYRGCLVLDDMLRDDARQAITSVGCRTLILSGDRQAVVDRHTALLGAGEGHGDLLPSDKAEFISRLGHEGRKVAFVGDGINDAPVLAKSSVGIAMGAGGADIAVEYADVVLRDDRPSKVADAMAIGRFTHRVVMQNVALSIGAKVMVMVLGTAGMANVWMAVLADTGVALVAIANSMRVFAKFRAASV